MRLEGDVGLVYRKLPFSQTGASSSWITSAGPAMMALVGSWGRISSDHVNRIYRFEALNLPGRLSPSLPDIDELINELLADYIIDRLDHPVLERPLNSTAPSMAATVEPALPDNVDEEDDHDIY